MRSLSLFIAAGLLAGCGAPLAVVPHADGQALSNEVGLQLAAEAAMRDAQLLVTSDMLKKGYSVQSVDAAPASFTTAARPATIAVQAGTLTAVAGAVPTNVAVGTATPVSGTVAVSSGAFTAAAGPAYVTGAMAVPAIGVPMPADGTALAAAAVPADGVSFTTTATPVGGFMAGASAQGGSVGAAASAEQGGLMAGTATLSTSAAMAVPAGALTTAATAANSEAGTTIAWARGPMPARVMTLAKRAVPVQASSGTVSFQDGDQRLAVTRAFDASGALAKVTVTLGGTLDGMQVQGQRVTTLQPDGSFQVAGTASFGSAHQFKWTSTLAADGSGHGTGALNRADGSTITLVTAAAADGSATVSCTDLGTAVAVKADGDNGFTATVDGVPVTLSR